MSDYVSRQYLLDEYDRQHQGPPGGARKIIKEAPSEDVAPVIHGKWVWLSSTYDRNPCERRFWCSRCHHEVITHDSDPWEKFCPNCGAKMEVDTR